MSSSSPGKGNKNGPFNRWRSRKKSGKEYPHQKAVADKIASTLSMLKTIFSTWEAETLSLLMQANQNDLERTIECILSIEETQTSNKVQKKRVKDHSDKKLFYETKPSLRQTLPDDFLRVPGYSKSKTNFTTSPATSEEKTELTSDDEIVDVEETKSEEKPYSTSIVVAPDASPSPVVDTVNNNNSTSTTLSTSTSFSEYRQKECSVASRERRSFSEDKNAARETTNTFLRNHSSKLDLDAAENRIKSQESHHLFDFLAKASKLYQDGVVNEQELEILRALLLQKEKRLKLYYQDSPSTGAYYSISDYEWGNFVLKCKNLRPALSTRIVGIQKEGLVIPNVKDSGYVVYRIHVVDIESGSSWFVSRRFREFNKLWKKVLQLRVKRLASVEFPTKGIKKFADDIELARKYRLPMLQHCLVELCALVTPAPVSFLRGCALKEFEKFIGISNSVRRRIENSLSDRSSSDEGRKRQVRVFVYQILSDPLTPEGKACMRFLHKMETEGMYEEILKEIKEFLDNLQSYVLQHRYMALEAFAKTVYQSHEDLQLWLYDIVRLEVEDIIIVPILGPLVEYLTKRNQVKEEELQRRMAFLKQKPQTYFEIPVDKISISSWASVVECVCKIDCVRLPCEKLNLIVASADKIHDLYREERRIVPDQSQVQVLSGDDFLPIYIYIIVQSQVTNLLVTLEILSNLCDPEKRLGQTGYCLASFEAAVSHILSRKLNN